MLKGTVSDGADQLLGVVGYVMHQSLVAPAGE